MRKVPSTPAYLVSDLKEFSKEKLRPLLHELSPGNGWEELVSLAAMSKGRIHKFIEKRTYLARWFKTVSHVLSHSVWFSVDRRYFSAMMLIILTQFFH